MVFTKEWVSLGTLTSLILIRVIPLPNNTALSHTHAWASIRLMTRTWSFWYSCSWKAISTGTSCSKNHNWPAPFSSVETAISQKALWGDDVLDCISPSDFSVFNAHGCPIYAAMIQLLGHSAASYPQGRQKGGRREHASGLREGPQDHRKADHPNKSQLLNPTIPLLNILWNPVMTSLNMPSFLLSTTLSF